MIRHLYIVSSAMQIFCSRKLQQWLYVAFSQQPTGLKNEATLEVHFSFILTFELYLVSKLCIILGVATLSNSSPSLSARCLRECTHIRQSILCPSTFNPLSPVCLTSCQPLHGWKRWTLAWYG